MSSSLYANHGGLFGPVVRWFIRTMVNLLEWYYKILREFIAHPLEDKWVLVATAAYAAFAIFLMWGAGWFQGCGHWNVWTGCS